jgi:uncharacterized protein (DUF2267 family)
MIDRMEPKSKEIRMAQSVSEQSGGMTPDEVSRDILRIVDTRGDLPHGVTPSDAVAAVMCVLSQRLSGGESRHLYNAMPPLLRREIRHCGLHPEQPELFDFVEFLSRLAGHLDVDPADAEVVANDVFGAVKVHLSPSEITHVRRQLPQDFGEFWSAALPGRKRTSILSGIPPESAELVREIGYRVDLPAHATPSDAAAAVMCALIQRITSGRPGIALGEAPERLRALMVPCTIHYELKDDQKGSEGFVRRVGRHLNLEDGDAEEVARGVLAIVKELLPAEEFAQIQEKLGGDMDVLWLEPQEA